MPELMMGDRARWSVLWVVKVPKKPARIVEVDFENDLKGALDLYEKVKRIGRPFATLRCCNVGFPPPDKYRPYYGPVWTGNYKTVRRNGKRYRKKVTQEQLITPMEDINLKGVWWCPYCREFRKFQHWDGVKTDGSFFRLIATKDPMFVPDPGMFCPLCGINQNDSHVRRWNPQAVLMEFRIQRKRRGNGRRGTRTSRTRRR